MRPPKHTVGTGIAILPIIIIIGTAIAIAIGATTFATTQGGAPPITMADGTQHRQATANAKPALKASPPAKAFSA